jgi:hypothetical protein
VDVHIEPRRVGEDLLIWSGSMAMQASLVGPVTSSVASGGPSTPAAPVCTWAMVGLAIFAPDSV